MHRIADGEHVEMLKDAARPVAYTLVRVTAAGILIALSWAAERVLRSPLVCARARRYAQWCYAAWIRGKECWRAFRARAPAETPRRAEVPLLGLDVRGGGSGDMIAAEHYELE